MNRTIWKSGFYVALVGWLFVSGCSSPGKRSKGSGYVPFSERPVGSDEYWKMRDAQDKLDEQTERRRQPSE
jgi:hypothetical protein